MLRQQARYQDDGGPVIKPNLAFVMIILGALIAFEIFNFSTTDYALRDLLGELTFVGLRWSTILSLAFCGIDFAGIARLFTPEQGMDEPKEVWYLFAAWLLAATMNAILTWWGVSMAVVTHTVQATAVIDPQTLATVVPVFVAVMVWVVRILIIGTLSIAADRMLRPNQAHQQTALERAVSLTNERAQQRRDSQPVFDNPRVPVQRPLPQPRAAAQPRAVDRSPQRTTPVPVERSSATPELQYHSLSARPPVNNRSSREGGANGGSGRSVRS